MCYVHQARVSLHNHRREDDRLIKSDIFFDKLPFEGFLAGDVSFLDSRRADRFFYPPSSEKGFVQKLHFLGTKQGRKDAAKNKGDDLWDLLG